MLHTANFVICYMLHMANFVICYMLHTAKYLLHKIKYLLHLIKYNIMSWLAGLGAGVVSGIGSLISGFSQADAIREANESNERIARENRDWQSSENTLNRQWEERMWNAQNLYNTPSAMMQRYREAGLNPYLVSKDSGQIGAASSAGTPGMVGAPSMPDIQPVNPLSGFAGFGSAVGLALQDKAVNANVANQQADAVSKIADALPKLGESLGWDNARSVAKQYLDLIGVNGSQHERMIDEQINSAKLHNDWQRVQNALASKYGDRRAATELQHLDQSISEIVGRLGLMSAQSDEARARIRVAASEFARNHADALKAIAETGTINALRDYVVGSAASESEMKSYELGERRSFYKSRTKLRDYIESDYEQTNIASKQAQESTYHSNPLYVFMNEVFRSLHIGH